MSTKKKILLVLIPIFLVFTISFATAATARAVEFDQDGIVEEGEVIDDDLFISGDIVEINGTVNGDVFAAGSVVKINGTVNGSLAAGAQSIYINGPISGSIYAAASTMTIDSKAVVGRNLYYAGFNLTTREGSYIGRDLLVGAYQALLSGEISRDIRAGVGALEISGIVGNDVIAEVAGPSEKQGPMIFAGPPGVETIVPSGLRVSQNAEIGGALIYKSSEDQSETIGMTPAGGVNFEYDPSLEDKRNPENHGRGSSTALVVPWIVKRVRMLITLALLGGLVVWQLPGLLKKVEEKAEKETVPSFGWGLVTILVVYLGAILVGGLILAGAIFFGVITLGELAKAILAIGFTSMGLVLAIFGLLVSYGSKIIVAYLVGKLLLDWLAPKFKGGMIWPLLIGLLLYTLLRAIPLGFGWLIGFTVTSIGIGAMWLTYRDHANSGQTPDDESRE